MKVTTEALAEAHARGRGMAEQALALSYETVIAEAFEGLRWSRAKGYMGNPGWRRFHLIPGWKLSSAWGQAGPSSRGKKMNTRALVILTAGLALVLPACRHPVASSATTRNAQTVTPEVAKLTVGPEVAKLTAEIESGLQRRKITGGFEKMEAFIGGPQKGYSTGCCRLPWVDGLLRHPLAAIGEADIFTRQAHAAASRQEGSVRAVVDIAAEKLTPAGPPATQATRPMQPGSSSRPAPLKEIARPDPLLSTNAGLATLAQAVIEARMDMEKAMAPLSDAELGELQAELYHQTTDTGDATGVAAEGEGRRIFDLLEKKVDQRSLHAAARSVSVLTEPKVLAEIGKIPSRVTTYVGTGVKGAVVACVDTPAGKIVIGGKEANEYRLDEMTEVCAVVDLGGDDVYLEGTVSSARPVLVIIDLAGNDGYRGVKPGIQGGAILGVSVLIDAAGNDTYDARDVVQGSCLGGFGLLIDMGGNDSYTGWRRVQGQAIAGIGLLIDRGGDDKYRGALLAQGVGGPLGFGMLDDLAGKDDYYAGGKYPNPYGDSPGYSGFSQGFGEGPRGVADGGIGVLLDGGGDDVYEADYFSIAGGYWFGAGFARDFGGNDQRLNSTRTAFDGSERKEARFLRWGIAFGCHCGLGFLFDDEGDDTYSGDAAGPAFAWDGGVAVLCDFKGNDRYNSPSHGLAATYAGGLAVLFDGGGDDVYAGAPPAMPHDTSQDFTFLLDLGGGRDQYPDNLENNKEYVRGWAGGFLIDK